MRVSVYTLTKTLFDDAALSVTASTITGEITILNHHRALITKLSEGLLKIVDEKKEEHFIQTKGGFTEVQGDNTVRILSD